MINFFLTNLYLLPIQILKTGFFHADPHPGNLAIDVDGSLIYYDFGMMGEIKPFTRERLLDLFYAVYEKDANKVSHNAHKKSIGLDLLVEGISQTYS